MSGELDAFLAAEDLARAIDAVTVLEKCERATGQPWVTQTDRERVKDKGARWAFLRADAHGRSTRLTSVDEVQAHAMRARERYR